MQIVRRPQPSEDLIALGSGAADLVHVARVLACAKGGHVGDIQELARSFALGTLTSARAEKILTNKAGVGAIGLADAGDANWAAASAAFSESLAASGTFDAMLAANFLRRLPPRQTIVASTDIAAINADNVLEGHAKPLGRLSLDASATAALSKAAATVVMTYEFLKNGGPQAETFLSAELRRALVAQSDDLFFTALLATSPPSVVSGGNDAAAVLNDLRRAFALVPLGSNSKPFVIVGSNRAKALSFLPTTTGAEAFNVSAIGGGQVGSLGGVPLFASDQLPDDTAIVGDANAIAADASVIGLQASRNAALEMSDTPVANSITPTGAQTVSMFQTNSVAIRAERSMYARPLRTDALAKITAVEWGEAGT